MKIPKRITETITVKAVRVHVKVCDAGHYTLLGEVAQKMAELDENYVPSFFPGEHHGDYLILDIELETGKILNWKPPSEMEVAEAFGLIDDSGR